MPQSAMSVRSEEHTSELQSRQYLHSFPTRRSSDLDVDRVVVMAGVDEHLGARAGLLGQQVGHAPVGDVGRVERGLEGLVLNEHGLLRAELPVQRLEALLEVALALADAALPRVARAVRKPERKIFAADRLHDGDGVEAMLDRARADLRVVVAERAPLVALVLENVGVDRAEFHTCLRAILTTFFGSSPRM